MTLKEAYKQWSQQKENYQLYVNTRSLFGKVWSHLPFHLECSEYSDNDLAKSLSLSKNSYEDKVKVTSVIIHILEYGLGKPTNFSTSNVLDIYNRTNAVDNNNNKESKPKPDIFKPLIYKNKPLIPQEVPTNKKVARKPKPVYQLDVDGNLIKEWESVKVVAEAIGVKAETIYKAISAKFKVIDSFWSRTPELTLVRERKHFHSPKSESKMKDIVVNKPEEDLLNSLSVLVSKIRKTGIKINVIIEL